MKENNTGTKKQLTETTPDRVSRAERADFNNDTNNASNGIPPALNLAWSSQGETKSVSQFGNFSIFEKYPRIMTKH